MSPSATAAGADAVAPSALETVRRTARRRRAVVVVATVVLVAVISLVALSMGDYPLTVEQVWHALWGGGTRAEAYVVFQVRAPRLVMALIAGAALGIAGALLQSLLGNPLASPDLLGISGGSGAAAIFALLVLGMSGPSLALAAFVGGMVVAGLLLLAGRAQTDGGYRLILAGVGMSFLAGAATSLLMVRAQVEQAQMAMLWLTGSLSSTPWWQVATVAVVFALVIPAVVAAARWLPIVQLGASTASGLGVRPGLVRVVTVTAAVILTAVTCAFLGPISFVALCAPAIARPLLGHASAGIATSGLIGAALLTTADLVAQYAIPGMSVPVGVVTGAIGALFLLWLLATSKGRQL
ncbi:iron ABC transporter permease [Microbacterium pumilum]|uniref:Iron chelate uptake ABC transporter family permease subunit n=1 Tax=Microbacterium pumilum TaxID=344165 RepID=A0ABP5E1Q0_9MICO